QGGQFGGVVNGGSVAPTPSFQDTAPSIPSPPPVVNNGQDDDDFVSVDQIRGSQFGGTSNGSAIAQFPVVPPNPAPVSPPPAPVSPPPAPAPPPPAQKTPPLTTPEVVADILKCPLKDSQKYLPGVLEALEEKGILDKPTLIAAIATIGVETGGFCPINEYGGPQYFTKMYEHRKDLGNVQPGDGARYHGRGFIQVTGRSNYRRYGEQLGLGRKLEDNPELALDPKISAQILAYYFYDRKVYQAARASDWRKVRKLVNGGYNGWNEFNNFVQRALQKL
ncbi:MAG TPA: glycoside hydrolase family 19 protein, partial [Cyanophyceae cyanobacterium]